MRSMLPLTGLLTTLFVFLGSPLFTQTYERRISDFLDERPNCVENTIDDGTIIAGTQKDLPMG